MKKNLSHLAAIMPFLSMMKMPYFAKVTSDRWGNRSKYIPAGVNKNVK